MKLHNASTIFAGGTFHVGENYI